MIRNFFEKLFEDIIDEYLKISKLCISNKNKNGGCYGYPAALLLFCIIDALGSCLRDEFVYIDGKRKKIGKETFKVLNYNLIFLIRN